MVTAQVAPTRATRPSAAVEVCSRVVRRRQEVATDWENNHRRGRFWGARRVVAWERADRRTVEKKVPSEKASEA